MRIETAPIPTGPALRLTLLPDRYAICQAPLGTSLPAELCEAGFVSITYAADEISIVLPESALAILASPADATDAPDTLRIEAPYGCLRVEGPLDFALVGILARLSGALAAANIPLFALSTFNTDYLLVRAEHIPAAIAALRGVGCHVDEASAP